MQYMGKSGPLTQVNEQELIRSKAACYIYTQMLAEIMTYANRLVVSH